ncbi:hypothetical protein NDU88_001060, partial [Pleurodeles waltl]
GKPRRASQARVIGDRNPKDLRVREWAHHADTTTEMLLSATWLWQRASLQARMSRPRGVV